MNTEREKFEEWVRGRGAIAHKIAGNESNYYAFATQCKWQAWQARAAIDSRGEAVPVAWLHDVVNDGEHDEALSFVPYAFPLDDIGYVSTGSRPLYLHPAAKD